MSVGFSTGLTFLLELTLKMAMTAAIVVVASIVVERSGPFIGAMIAALPTAAGAVYMAAASVLAQVQWRRGMVCSGLRDARRPSPDAPAKSKAG